MLPVRFLREEYELFRSKSTPLHRGFVRERASFVTITYEKRGRITVLQLKGTFVGRPNVALFERSIFDHLKEEIIWIILDLGGLKHIDSAGLGAMISAMVSVGKRGGGLRLAAVTGDVQNIMTKMHLDQVFEIHDSVQQAEASMPS
jgi:anti-sigma B factor antagonist